MVASEAATITLGTTGTERVRIGASGGVGINTASVSFPLTVSDSSGVGLVIQSATTVARGGGLNYMQFTDPTGQKGYVGYGTTNDAFYVENTLNNDILFNTNATEKLRLTANGRLYGTALHNTAGAVTGTTNQYIASGTWTPTLTNVANISASTASPCQWIRVGNVVTCSLYFSVDPITAGSTTNLGISLPIASGLASISQVAGSTNCENTTNNAGGVILADVANDRAQMNFVPASNVDSVWTGTMTYVIV